MTSGWAEIYSARFGKTLSDLEHRTWESEIEHDIRDCRQEEIVRAIRDLGEEKRKNPGKMKYNPTIEKIISRVLKNRWQDREDERRATMGTCECRAGTILICPEADNLDYVAATFCGCSKGRDLIQRKYRDSEDVERVTEECADIRRRGVPLSLAREQQYDRMQQFPTPEQWGDAGDWMRSYWKWLFGERVAEYEDVLPIKDDHTATIGASGKMMTDVVTIVVDEMTDQPEGVPF